jgi:RimJ/RimL family protein N-acetyltransferase
MPEATLVRIPSLETARTVLRAHQPGDFDAYARMWTEPAVTRFIGGRARSREESWIRFLRHAGMWAMTGFGFWAIEEKESGRLLGEAGFHELRRDLTPSIEGFAEAGWSLVPEAHGRGVATEVVGAVVAWGDRELRGRRQVCIIDPKNHASLRVAQKCGFRDPVEARLGEETVLLFERERMVFA